MRKKTTPQIWPEVIITLGVECALVWLLLGAAIGPLPAASLHAATIGWLTLRIRRSYREKNDLRMLLLLASASAVMGPFGAAGAALTLALLPWCARSAVAFEKWYASLFPEDAGDFDEQLRRQLDLDDPERGETAGVVPFVDILTFGTRSQKQAAISLIAGRFQPAFAPALHMALNMSDGAIRVQAATAMTRIENGFLERALELSRSVKEGPQNPELILALARHYDRYAFAGILDERRERENRERAVAEYEAYLRLEAGDKAARSELGRILVRMGNFERAAEVLECAIDEGNSSPQAVVWYLESLYRLRRFPDLREFIRTAGDRMPGSGDLPAEAVEALKLWGPADGAPGPTRAAAT
ncbi:MAG: hypothetical protein FJW35_00085 [Acidobacteria bacterium]|nr:hypothetical protein [Acidobacteriota bacterium]